MMLYAFGFNRLAVLVGDLYFQHPDPPVTHTAAKSVSPKHGPEHGVRIELRRIEACQLQGSVYSARPITLNEPVWRVDLLESVQGEVGSFDRVHHHPQFDGWDEGVRDFEESLTNEPLRWLEEQLTDLQRVLARAQCDPDAASQEDIDGIRVAAPEIVASVVRLLNKVRDGRGPRPPKDTKGLIRAGWL
jgi:hypothetical protein